MSEQESSRKRSNPQPKKSLFENKAVRIGLVLVVLIVVVVAVYAFYPRNQTNGNTNPTGNPIAVFNTSLGTFRVELYKDKMPVTTANFVKLANDGFYNGLIFHRINKTFMIQGGGYLPDGTEKQDPYGPINLETSPDVTHVAGAISMARTPDPNSATSQFFICIDPQPGLDGQYAAFGVVTEGFDVVKTIAAQPHDNAGGDGTGTPSTNIIINSITIVYQ